MAMEIYQKVLLGLGVLLCLVFAFFLGSFLIGGSDEPGTSQGLVPSITSAAVQDGSENIRVEDFGEEIVRYDIQLFPEFIQKHSIKVKIQDVFVQCDEENVCDLHVVVDAEDTISDEQQSKASGNFFVRSPHFWFGRLYLYRGEVEEFFLCDQDKEDRFWSNTFCIPLDDLNTYYFGQKIRFIYSTKQTAEIEDLLSRDLEKLERTYVFDLQLPQELYEEHVSR